MNRLPAAFAVIALLLPLSESPAQNLNWLQSATLAADARTTIELSPDEREHCRLILVEGLLCDEFWPSIHAAEGLSIGGYGETVRKHLEPKLLTTLDDQQRCGVSRELMRAGDRLKAGIMLSILAGKDDFGHIHAAESLYKLEEIGDGVAMRRAFEQSDNLRLRVMAAAALGRCGNPQAMAFLRAEVLSHEDSEIYKLAAWVLGRIGDASDIPLLKKHLKRCPDELTRAYFQNSLATLGDADGLKALAASLTSEDPAVRTYGATFAGDARALGLKDALWKMLDDPNADTRYRAAQSLLDLSRLPKPNRTEDVSSLVWQATKENPRYTEGSIIERADGSLLFAATEFHGSGSDFAKAHIVGRTSTDGGRTWSEKRVLQENTGGLNVMSVTLRRLSSGLALFYLQKNDFNDLDMYLRVSKDEGQSFGEPTLVTGDAGYHVVNNDRVTQLSTGRLLVPAASTADVKKVNHFVSHCYLSDDGGKTWRNGKGHLDAPKRGAMEPEVVELSDGRVLMIVRTQLGFIGKSYSKDGGDTWSKMETLGVRAPEAPSTLRRIPSTGDLLLIWNDTFIEGAGHGGQRTPLTAAISSDDGATWKTVGNLETDPNKTYAYTSLTFVGDRAVMSYWESGKSGEYSCKFRSVPVSWFYR
ncbi:MAG: exo-alpha-sialidase [Planctomycetota bacterium]|nr:exo-alpha-sialidase [Planctomycetota bacterium]MDA1252513.1 exo-alpha-sialidase [Planctomycetota bacterium]